MQSPCKLMATIIMAKPASYGAISENNNSHIVQIDDDTASSTSDVERLRRSKEAGESFLANNGSHHYRHPHVAQTATIPSEVANITKNLIGGGVLSLPGGIALFADSPVASIYAIGCVVILGAVMGYFCLLIGKSCDETRSTTYREAWEKTVGSRGGMTVAVVNTLDPLLGIFANATIMAQSLQLMLQGVDVYWTVQECLLLITLVAVLPLCLMKNLSALAPFSSAALAAVLFALAVMVKRYLDGSYQPDGGVFYEELSPEMKPSFGTRNHPFSTKALPFVCMVYASFDMHYNSPRYYAELRDASIPRFGEAVFYGFTTGSFLLFSIAVAGYLTFGGNCDSFILNNYSRKDPLATLSRLAIGLCSLVAYPLNFIGVRNNCLDIFGIADKINTAAKFNAFTIFVLSTLTVISCFVTDLGLISSVGGGTTVTLVCFVFPALMFCALIQNKSDHGTVGERLEALLVMVLMVIGVILGLIGVTRSIIRDDSE